MLLAEMVVEANICAANEHIPEVERSIRYIKERVQAAYNSLPIKKYPARMIIEMVYNTIYWLNAVPAQDGVSKTQSPNTIIT